MRAVLFVPFLASGLWAQADGIELKDLLAVALNNNPEVAAAQKRYEASRQRPTQVSSLPDPMFSPGYKAAGDHGRAVGWELMSQAISAR